MRIMNTISWSARIKALEAIGWSLTDIARAVGKSTGAISDLKHGRITEPTGMAAVRLHHLHAMGIRPSDVFAPSARTRRGVAGVQESGSQQQDALASIMPLYPIQSVMMEGGGTQ